MHRRFSDKKLIIASHNAGKVREIRALLSPFGVEVVSASDLDLPEPVEDGTTFEANAEIKALAAAKAAKMPALSDDSGLEVHALDGDPGIYSARWAGPNKDFNQAMEKVLVTLNEKGADNYNANFTCALTLAWPDGHMETFLGKVFGSLTWPMRGDKGFGYDPIFIPEGKDITFAEMDPALKHDISHRADAFRQMIDACFKPE